MLFMQSFFKVNYSFDYMKTDDVIVLDSKIHGKGVFASSDFKKGEIVLRWNISSTLSKEEIIKKSDEDKKHIAFFENKYVVMQEPEKYVNHSCNSNTSIRNFCDFAIRDIKKGEEITGNYTEDLLPNSLLNCNCGCINCEKIIKRNL